MKNRTLSALVAVWCGITSAGGAGAPDGAEATLTALTRAVELEKTYDWDKARAEYDRVLAQEPGHEAAKAGRERATQVLIALRQYDVWLAEADRQAQAANFQRAIRAFNEAMTVKPEYLHNERMQALRATLLAQNAPVDVTLTSDGLTWVLIENYRAPKQLQRETIKVLPGNYRVIGRRLGYHDVELDLIVRGGSSPTLAVICQTPASANGGGNAAVETEYFERMYQQALAKARAAEAKEKAEISSRLENIRRLYAP